MDLPLILGHPFMATAVHGTDSLERVLTQNSQASDIDEDEIHEVVQFLDALPTVSCKYPPTFEPLPVNTEKFIPSLVRAPELELKPLPSHLKYVYLGESKTMSVIIACNFSEQDEEYCGQQGDKPNRTHAHIGR
ncbi:unnamed protein product [Prunus armeniaca]